MTIAYAVYSAVHATKAAQETGAVLPNDIFDKYFKTFTMAADPGVPFETADSYKKAKQQAKAIIFCTFKNPSDTERLGEKIDKYTGIALDIDNKADEISEDENAPPHITRHELFDKYSDLEYIFYTTFSHNQPVPCKDGSTLKAREKFRIVFFYDRPATIEEHRQIYDYLASRLSCPAYSDKQMKTQALSLSLPMCRQSKKNDAESLYHSGDRLKVDEIIGGRNDGLLLDASILDNKRSRGLPNISLVSKNNITNTAVNDKNEKSVKNILKIDEDFSNFANNISNAIKLLSMLECKNIAYNDWLEILGACKSTGVPWEVFDGWCRTDMARYDYNENRKKWDDDKYRAGIAGFIEIARRLGINVTYNHAKKDLLFTKVSDIEQPSEDDFDDYEYCLPQKFIDAAPDIIHMIMEHTESCAYAVVKEVSFAGALGTVAALCHKRIITEDYTCPNMLTLAIAESGAGKDAATSVMQAILNEDMLGVYATTSSAESKGGFIEDMIGTGGNWMYIATEAKGMLFDKFDKTNRASHLKGFEEEFTSMFDRSRTQHDGHGKIKGQQDNQFDLTPQKIKKNPIYAPHFSFFGTTTPDVLPIFNSVSGTNGLLGRFFVVIGPKTPQHRPFKTGLNRFHMFSDQLRRNLNQYMKLRVADGQREQPQIVRYDQGVAEYAYTRTEAITDIQRKFIINDDDRAAHSLMTRIAINAMKLALVCTPLGDSISVKRLEWAYDVLIESQTRARAAISSLNEKTKAKKYEPFYDRVYKAICQGAEYQLGVTMRELQRKLRCYSSDQMMQLKATVGQLEMDQLILGLRDGKTISYRPLKRR